ncbi:hypothetical protein RRF57_011918 [Xylaria bambusicola]|uniref:Uncharacterized protein n=1 Tax=Xylaria bambusicola TaxID=326684 RepID=A0AAN7V026_9PEZI
MAKDASAAGLDAQLLLLLGDPEALHALLNEEGCDSTVALRRVEVREHDKEPGFHCIGNPHLATRDLEAVACFSGLGGKFESIRPRHRLAQAKATNCISGQTGQEFLLDVVSAPFQESRVDQCVMHVDHDAHTRIGAS